MAIPKKNRKIKSKRFLKNLIVNFIVIDWTNNCYEIVEFRKKCSNDLSICPIQLMFSYLLQMVIQNIW